MKIDELLNRLQQIRDLADENADVFVVPDDELDVISLGIANVVDVEYDLDSASAVILVRD